MDRCPVSVRSMRRLRGREAETYAARNELVYTAMVGTTNSRRSESSRTLLPQEAIGYIPDLTTNVAAAYMMLWVKVMDCDSYVSLARLVG